MGLYSRVYGTAKKQVSWNLFMRDFEFAKLLAEPKILHTRGDPLPCFHESSFPLSHGCISKSHSGRQLQSLYFH